MNQSKLLAPVVQRLNNVIHRINHYPADSVVCFVTLIRWIAIYPVDSVIQPLNNWGQVITCSWRKARENSSERIPVDLGFTPDWMKKWRELFEPIAQRPSLRHSFIQSGVKPERFPALCVSYMKLLRVLIVSLDCLCRLWLAKVKTLVLLLQHSARVFTRDVYLGFVFTLLKWSF